MSEKNSFDSNWIDFDGQDNIPDDNINLDKLRQSVRSGDSDDSIFIPELAKSQSTSDKISDKNKNKKETESPESSSSGKTKKGFSLLGPALVAVVLILLGFAGFKVYKLLSTQTAKPAERTILNNVYIAGVNVGGLYRSQAADALTKGLEQTLYADPMRIDLPDSSISINPEDVGLYLDVQAAVDAAMEYGRSGPDAQAQVLAAQNGEVTRLDILPYLRLNEDYLRTILTKAADSVTGDFQPSNYFLEGNAPMLDGAQFDPSFPCQTLVLQKGVPGQGIDPDSLYNDVLAAYNDGITTVSRTDANVPRIPAELDLELIHRILTVSPKETMLDSKTLTIIPGSYGYTFDLDAARSALERADYGTEVAIPMMYIAPDVKSDGVYCTDELASTTIACNPADLPNLTAASSAAHAVIIPVGKQYSYQIPAAMDLEVEDCQDAPVKDDSFCMLASSLYQSALKAGLQTSDVKHHSYCPDYCEGGTDVRLGRRSSLSIRNTSDNPVMILVDVDSSSFTVRILGTKTDAVSISLTSELVAEKDFKVTERIMDADSGYTDGQVIQEGMKKSTYALHLVTVDSQSGDVLSDKTIETIRYPGCEQIIARIAN